MGFEQMLLLALLAGGCGALMGCTQQFIAYGMAGLIGLAMQACGADTALFDDVVLNCFLLPCVSSTGAMVGAAVAGKRSSFPGEEMNRSLGLVKDAWPLIAGSVGGALGYVLICAFNDLGLTIDTGALSFMTMCLITRALLGTGPGGGRSNLDLRIDPMTGVVLSVRLREGAGVSGGAIVRQGFHPMPAAAFACDMGHVRALAHDGGALALHAATAVLVAGSSALVCDWTGIQNVAFYVTAVLLTFALISDGFIACHHTALVAGYAVIATGSVDLAVALGVAAHFTGLFFAEGFNVRRGTHIDPPAVAIAIFSALIFTLA